MNSSNCLDGWKMSTRSWLMIAMTCCGLGSGCTAERPTSTAVDAAVDSTRLSLLLPLEHDTISQFESFMDAGPPGMFVLEISRPRPELAELSIAGRVQRLLIEPGRVRHATGGTLLEEPLETGHQYRGSFGTVTITDTDFELNVPAGHFEHCLVTVEESTQPPRRSTSVFCPKVGLASLSVEAFGGEGGLLENRLTQHGPRFK